MHHVDPCCRDVWWAAHFVMRVTSSGFLDWHAGPMLDNVRLLDTGRLCLIWCSLKSGMLSVVFWVIAWRKHQLTTIAWLWRWWLEKGSKQVSRWEHSFCRGTIGKKSSSIEWCCYERTRESSNRWRFYKMMGPKNCSPVWMVDWTCPEAWGYHFVDSMFHVSVGQFLSQ